MILRVAFLLCCTVGLGVNADAQTAPAPPVSIDGGLGEGFTIRSGDGTASLNIRARIQIRSTVIDNPDDQPDTSEILIRRARLVFQGAAMPRLSYYVQLSFANLDNEADLPLPLRDAYVTWSATRDLTLRVGQMKVPFSRQRVISSSALQMVDRSIVVSELNLDRDVGLQLFSRDLFGVGKLGYAVGIFGGEGRNRLGRSIGYLYAARLETWPLGAFDDAVEGDLQRSPKLRIGFGASVAYNQNTNRPRSTTLAPDPAGDFDYAHAALDAMVKKSGWSLIAEVMYRGADRQQRTVELNDSPMLITSRSGWGAYIQAGRMLSERIEFSARYSHLAPAEGAQETFLEANERGLSASYYLREHNLKVQGDYFYVVIPTADRRTHQTRVQFQLFF